jgi:hypothetical protein
MSSSDYTQQSHQSNPSYVKNSDRILYGILYGSIIGLIIIGIWIYWAMIIYRYSEERIGGHMLKKFVGKLRSTRAQDELDNTTQFIPNDPVHDPQSQIIPKGTPITENTTSSTKLNIIQSPKNKETYFKYNNVFIDPNKTYATCDIEELNNQTGLLLSSTSVRYEFTIDCEIYNNECIDV